MAKFLKAPSMRRLVKIGKVLVIAGVFAYATLEYFGETAQFVWVLMFFCWLAGAEVGKRNGKREGELDGEHQAIVELDELGCVDLEKCDVPERREHFENLLRREY